MITSWLFSHSSSKIVISTTELLKKSKYWKKWETRSVWLDSSGSLSWTGGVGHTGFVKISAHTIVSKRDEEGSKSGGYEFTVMADGRMLEFASKTEADRDIFVNGIADFIAS